MGKVDEKKRIKQKALLKSAFELFTEKGINDTSIADIVKKAKMAKGTFYLYFRDKYDIRDHLIAKHTSSLFDNAAEAMDEEKCQTLEEKIVFIADYIIDQLAQNKALLRFISKNLSWAVFSDICLSEGDNSNCMNLFDELMRDSDRTFRQKNLMIYMIVELVNSTSYNVILHQSPVTLEELKQDLNLAICNIIHQFEVKE